MEPFTQVQIGLIVCSIIMFAGWLVAWKRQNASHVDLLWTLNLGLLAVFYAMYGSGDVVQRWLIGSMAAIWSLRLSYHIFIDRIWGKSEDGRYVALRKRWGRNAGFYFLIFFLAQAGLDIIFSLSYLIAAQVSSTRLEISAIVGIVIWGVSVGGEAIADRQLARFRADPANKGKTCQIGLWRYSRHPNYFFEWLHWWSYVAMSVHSPYFWLTLISPALMLFFLFKITGIPATEAHALQSRGEEYRRYQQTTSAFFPWFPKEARKE